MGGWLSRAVGKLRARRRTVKQREIVLGMIKPKHDDITVVPLRANVSVYF